MSKVNLQTQSNEKLAELAKEYKLDVPEGTPREALIAALKEVMAATPAGQDTAGQPDTKPDDSPKASKRGQIFYWIKIPTYANDTDICQPGVYRTAARIERFDRSEIRFVERFDGEIPETVLFDIAKRLGISTDKVVGNKRVFRDYEDIIEELVTDR